MKGIFPIRGLSSCILCFKAKANVHYYRQHVIELREQLLHQETANSKLVLDIEKQTQQIYELRDQLLAAQNELSNKDRECYSLHKELSDAQTQIQAQ